MVNQAHPFNELISSMLMDSLARRNKPPNHSL